MLWESASRLYFALPKATNTVDTPCLAPQVQLALGAERGGWRTAEPGPNGEPSRGRVLNELRKLKLMILQTRLRDEVRLRAPLPPAQTLPS